MATGTKVRIDEHITDNRDAVDVLHAGVLGVYEKRGCLGLLASRGAPRIFARRGDNFFHV